jgi:hypothetical protein
MGYIEKADGIASFNKAVASIWFRIPQAAIDAAIAQYEAIPVSVGSLTDMNMPGIIPLWAFGEPSAITGGAADFTSRSFIGVACGHITNSDMLDEEPLPPPRMMVYLQYNTGELGIPGGSPDSSDFFQIGGEPGLFAYPGSRLDGQFITVTADAWHHILVSFDLSGGCEVSYDAVGATGISFDTPCQFWWAFDDVNYDGEYLWPSNPNVYEEETGGANDIYSQGMFTVSAISTPHEFAAGDLPVSGNPIGFPAVGADSSRVYNIIMTEVQIFTGVSLDTSVEDNRRLFITSLGGPAHPASAADFFDKQPEIYIQTHEDAATGHNSGTAGNFEPTGTITQFTPGPS